MRPYSVPRRPATVAVATGLLLVMWLAAGSPPTLKGPGTGTKAGVLFSVPVESKVVALTFDDGPSQNLTPQVLDLLARYSARATFFPIGGEVKRFPDISRRVLAEGHEIGCHTYNHVYLKSRGVARLGSELDLCEKLMTEELGLRATLFRFPGLSYNDDLVKAATKRGYSVVSCSLDSFDFRIKDARRAATRVRSMARPGDIILLHDGGWIDSKRQVQLLEFVLKELREDGYRFVTVSELVRLGLVEGSESGGSE